MKPTRPKAAISAFASASEPKASVPLVGVAGQKYGLQTKGAVKAPLGVFAAAAQEDKAGVARSCALLGAHPAFFCAAPQTTQQMLKAQMEARAKKVRLLRSKPH
jgi:hypothetical protein